MSKINNKNDAINYIIECLDSLLNSVTLILIILKLFNLIQWSWFSVLIMYMIPRVVALFQFLAKRTQKR